jgi:hypothetical protein
MDNQMWLALLGGASFAAALIAGGFWAMHAEKRYYEWLKKNGRI